jgi:pimeloyl-ACP methyl ester carboxylesterase
VIAPDLRGRADSVAVAGPFSLAQPIADMIMILDQLEIDSIHICGMSMGGFVAMQLAAQHNLAHDLRDGRVGLSPDALLADAGGHLLRLKSLGKGPGADSFPACPIGCRRRQCPQYPPDLVDRYRPYTVGEELLNELDHAGTIMTHRAAAVVAEMIQAALRADSGMSASSGIAAEDLIMDTADVIRQHERSCRRFTAADVGSFVLDQGSGEAVFASMVYQRQHFCTAR